MSIRALIVLMCAVLLAGCTVNRANSDRATDQNIATRCRQLDAGIALATHPTPAMIARHDRLVEDAAEFMIEAQEISASGGSPDALIGKSVQAKMDADAIYDAASYREQADRCWAFLATAQEIRADMHQRAVRAFVESPRPRTPIFTPPQPLNVPTMPTLTSTVEPVDMCSKMSCRREPPPMPQYVPYEEVAPLMPGIRPDGTAR